MFLLNNIHMVPHKKNYPEYRTVFFDLSEKQLKNAKTSDWGAIKPGDIACVVNETRKVDTFYRVAAVTVTNTVYDEWGRSHLLLGRVVAKMNGGAVTMSTLLMRHGVEHKYLPRNEFSPGFNVANLGDALDSVKVKSGNSITTIGEMKKPRE